MLTLHYDRCAKYYGSTGGQGIYGASSDEEKRLTMMLFSNIFDSLSKMVYFIFIFYVLLFIKTIQICRTMTQNSSEKHYRVYLLLVVLCLQIIHCLRIMMMNGTDQNKIFKDLQMDLTILNQSIPTGIFFYNFALNNE